MTARVWLHDACAEAPPPPDVGEQLRAAGVEGAPATAADPGSDEPGLLLFDRPGPETFQIVRDVSGNGRRRVVAVARTRQGLLGGTAWSLMAAGAADVLAWDDPSLAARIIAARLERWEAVGRLLASPAIRDQLIGESRAWLAFLRQLVEVAAFTEAPILLLGESGTGKELAARLVHVLDRRPVKRDLTVLDCTTIVAELSGSEFFGHERGAFTGAASARDGAFSLADGGTLFLDEVGELTPSLQAQLLRVVQERAYKRVGGNTWYRSEFRLVCATNRDLGAEVAHGGFRRDFFHRIAGCVCRVPPLRERAEDILPLALHFLRELRPDLPGLELDEPVRAYLIQRDYPGNVRDLRQLVARISRHHVGPGPITVGDVPPEELPAGAGAAEWEDAGFEGAIVRALALGVGLKEIGRRASEAAIRLALEAEQGNLQRAARRLGVTDRALQMRRAQRGEGE